jgi:type III pantothenate kinase
MLAALEVGNTNIVFALFDGHAIRRQWRLLTDRARNADEYGTELFDLLASEHIAADTLEGIALASVVPAVGDTLAETATRYLRRPLTVLRTADDLGIVNLCKPPEAVGIDRLLNAFAAHALYGGPAIVLDLGTATTFDVVSADGEFLGGAIAPGIMIAAEALWTAAPRLPHVELVPPSRVIARNTTEALQSGIVLGYAQFVDGMLNQMRQELGVRSRAIATGGLAPVLSGVTNEIDSIEPDLTLHGIRLAYTRLQPVRA